VSVRQKRAWDYLVPSKKKRKEREKEKHVVIFSLALDIFRMPASSLERKCDLDRLQIRDTPCFVTLRIECFKGAAELVITRWKGVTLWRGQPDNNEVTKGAARSTPWSCCSSIPCVCDFMPCYPKCRVVPSINCIYRGRLRQIDYRIADLTGRSFELRVQ